MISGNDPVHVKSVALLAFACFLPLWLNAIPAFASWAHQPSVVGYYDFALVAWAFVFNWLIIRVRDHRYGRVNS